jgi:hypothetical protein
MFERHCGITRKRTYTLLLIAIIAEVVQAVKTDSEQIITTPCRQRKGVLGAPG